MKVTIGYRLQDGPWGGGNQFAKALSEALQARGDSVRFDLADRDVDIIVLTDPRAYSPTVSFGAGAILRYLFRNPRALVVHRINECDERKGTNYMNAMLRRSNYVADHTVFIASWLRKLAVWSRRGGNSVILNGADARVFHPRGQPRWNGQGPLRLVTHHWGGNQLKGFDVYLELDRLLDDPGWRSMYEFTYVGNLPNGIRFRNTRYCSPLAGEALAAELASHHVYLTASINEPAGMHHIEGAMCGLPLVFRCSGALPEYCEGFGIGFEGNEFVPALNSMRERYVEMASLIPSYPHTANRMCTNYLELFDSLLQRRDEVIGRRNLWRNPWLVLRNQLSR